METLLLQKSKDDIETAAKILRSGGLVAMPTETVYGLAANALDKEAVNSIFVAKGRPSDNPLIVHISCIEDIERFALVSEFPEKARLLACRFWPGALTIIMPKGDAVPTEVTAGLDSVAIRLPSHPTAQALIAAAGCPLAAPSANLSGSPSPTTAQHVMDDMKGRIPAIIDGGESDVGLESTVITLCTPIPTVLRPGGVTVEELRDVIGEVNISDAVLNKLRDDEKAASPGMKYRHYSPNASVILLRDKADRFCDFVNKTDAHTAVLCCDEDIPRLDKNKKYISLGSLNDYNAQAHNLFSALRDADKLPGINTIYVRCPHTDGVGMAIFNRLIRAAGFEVIDIE